MNCRHVSHVSPQVLTVFGVGSVSLAQWLYTHPKLCDCMYRPLYILNGVEASWVTYALQCLRSMPGADCDNTGVTTISTGPNGCVVHTVDWGPFSLNQNRLIILTMKKS